MNLLMVEEKRMDKERKGRYDSKTGEYLADEKSTFVLVEEEAVLEEKIGEEEGPLDAEFTLEKEEQEQENAKKSLENDNSLREEVQNKLDESVSCFEKEKIEIEGSQDFVQKKEKDNISEEVSEEEIEEKVIGCSENIEQKQENTEETLYIVLQQIEQLHKKFDSKIQKSETQDILVKKLYAEVQEYKKDLYSTMMKPLLMEFIQMRNNILKMGLSLEKKDKNAVISVKDFLSFAYDIEDVLENYNIEIFSSNFGEEFDPRRQKVLKKQVTDDENLHKKIAKSVSDGYIYGSRIMVKEAVVVYAYEPLTENKEN